MRTRVKICGITRVGDALDAVEMGADAVGFIFYHGSRREASQSVAREVAKRLPAFVTPVGVFVNADAATIKSVAEETGIRAVQLHGKEPMALIASLTLPVIRVVRELDEQELDSIGNMQGVSFLVDTADAQEFGGTGRLSDWNVASRLKKWGPVILSGGLTAENVGEGIRSVQPYAVDVSSGVESEPGKKDVGKIAEFVQAVHQADLFRQGSVR